MASVTFPPALGGDGSTVTDDSNPTTGLANGGHRVRFVPALAQVVNMANSSVTSATNSAASATTAATNATSAATSASNAATSATNAAASAAYCASLASAIAGGPVASINGLTGIVSFASTNLTDAVTVTRNMRRARMALLNTI